MNKRTHLIFSGILLLPVAFGYGFGHQWFPLFSFDVRTVDLASIFKAIMGLYVGLALFWLYACKNPKYWRAATLSNVLFMLGLALGRSLSVLTDGVPSEIWLFGTLGEYVLGFWGLYNLKKYKS